MCWDMNGLELTISLIENYIIHLTLRRRCLIAAFATPFNINIFLGAELQRRAGFLGTWNHELIIKIFTSECCTVIEWQPTFTRLSYLTICHTSYLNTFSTTSFIWFEVFPSLEQGWNSTIIYIASMKIHLPKHNLFYTSQPILVWLILCFPFQCRWLFYIYLRLEMATFHQPTLSKIIPLLFYVHDITYLVNGVSYFACWSYLLWTAFSLYWQGFNNKIV